MMMVVEPQMEPLMHPPMQSPIRLPMQRELALSLAEQFDRFARYYDGDYRNYVEDLDLIVDLADESDSPVLELGCGTGRVMRALLEAGCTVTGVDVSSQMLDVARGKLEALPADGRYGLVQDDLTTFVLQDDGFGLAVCASNTLMHLTDPAQQMALMRNAHRHLADGGRLLIDLFNPDVARLVAVNNVMELADEWVDDELGVHVVKWSVRTVDFAEQLQDTLFVYEESDAVETGGAVRRTLCPFTLRFLWRSEAELMLQASGFRVEAIWGDFFGEPYSAESERLVLLAQKV